MDVCDVFFEVSHKRAKIVFRVAISCLLYEFIVYGFSLYQEILIRVFN